MSIQGNAGFKAYDVNACSIYVAKGGDVITWSIQTMNPSTLPDLCTITAGARCHRTASTDISEYEGLVFR